MTGAYLRVKRYGKWMNKEIEYLTPQEVTETFKDRSPEELINWINFLIENLAPIAQDVDNQSTLIYPLKE